VANVDGVGVARVHGDAVDAAGDRLAVVADVPSWPLSSGAGPTGNHCTGTFGVNGVPAPWTTSGSPATVTAPCSSSDEPLATTVPPPSTTMAVPVLAALVTFAVSGTVSPDSAPPKRRSKTVGELGTTVAVPLAPSSVLRAVPRFAWSAAVPVNVNVGAGDRRPGAAAREGAAAGDGGRHGRRR